MPTMASTASERRRGGAVIRASSCAHGTRRRWSALESRLEAQGGTGARSRRVATARCRPPGARLRVGLPLLLLVHLAWVSQSPLSSWREGNHSLGARRALGDPWVPGLPTLASAIAVSRDERARRITFLLSCYAGGLLALALGFHTRVSALLAWGLHLALVTSGSASVYDVNQMASTFFSISFVFPSGRAGTCRARSSLPTPGPDAPVGS